MQTEMKGTSGSTFTVIAQFVAGLIGFRSLGGGSYRVRVNPAAGASLTFPSGWKTPGDGQNRFSIVTSNLVGALQEASAILAAASVTMLEGKAEPDGDGGSFADALDEVEPEVEAAKESGLTPMYGTSGAPYNVVGEFLAGSVGYRDLGGEVRVRIVPADGVVLNLDDICNEWKKPGVDGQNRYSKVGPTESLNGLLATATKALASASVNMALGFAAAA